MNTYFKEIKKNFGFGCMRLPLNGDEVDIEQMCDMVDLFLENGFNYFDTAHGYLDGKSEIALRKCLTERYPRDKYTLTNKLTNVFFKDTEEIRPFLDSQLKACGVEYFDIYLMHAQNADIYEYFKKNKAYETALELKEEGKFRHFGISFHDKAEVLEKILTEYPQIEVVQIQFNYLDYDDPIIESRKCYEVCRKFNKPVIVMEPVKGGTLSGLPEEAEKIIADLNGGTPASYAIRYAAGFDGIMMVISEMSNVEQMKDNISFMKEYKQLDSEELKAVSKVKDVFKSMNMIPCTSCGYCLAGCPKMIKIPNMFSLMNTKNIRKEDWNADLYYGIFTEGEEAKASDCIKCGKCEKICPQQLPIRNLLDDVAKEFESN